MNMHLISYHVALNVLILSMIGRKYKVSKIEMSVAGQVQMIQRLILNIGQWALPPGMHT